MYFQPLSCAQRWIKAFPFSAVYSAFNTVHPINPGEDSLILQFIPLCHEVCPETASVISGSCQMVFQRAFKYRFLSRNLDVEKRNGQLLLVDCGKHCIFLHFVKMRLSPDVPLQVPSSSYACVPVSLPLKVHHRRNLLPSHTYDLPCCNSRYEVVINIVTYPLLALPTLWHKISDNAYNLWV